MTILKHVTFARYVGNLMKNTSGTVQPIPVVGAAYSWLQIDFVDPLLK